MPRGVPNPRFVGPVTYTQLRGGIVIIQDTRAARRLLNKIEKVLRGGMNEACSDARYYMARKLREHLDKGLELRGGTGEFMTAAPTPMRPLREWTIMNKEIQGSATPEKPLIMTGAMRRGIKVVAKREGDSIALIVVGANAEVQRKMEAHMFPEHFKTIKGDWTIFIYKRALRRNVKRSRLDEGDKSEVAAVRLRKIKHYSRMFLFMEARELKYVFANIERGIVKVTGVSPQDMRAESGALYAEYPD